MKSRHMALALVSGLFITGAGTAVAQSKGDWVLGRYQGGTYWYPGVIESVSGSRIKVVYDDGDRESLHIRDVRPYDWKVGTRVECNWKQGGTWYPGKITALGGANLSINYDDGDKERTVTGLCRSR